MRYRNPILLSLILVIQVALFGYLYQYKTSNDEAQETVLAGFDVQQLQQISIESNLNIEGLDASTLNFNKTSDTWQLVLPEGQSLAINNTLLTDLIDKLAKLKPTLAVAESADAAERFEVAEDKYQRKIHLKKANSETTLYLGTSPGYQQTHARNHQQQAVYSIKVSNSDIPAEASDWLDRSQLAISTAITQITGSDYTINLTNSSWTLTSAQDKDVLGEDLLTTLIDTFKNLKITKLTTKKHFTDSTETTTVSVKTTAEKIDFKLARIGEEYYIRRNQGLIFSLNQDQYAILTTRPIFTATQPSSKSSEE